MLDNIIILESDIKNLRVTFNWFLKMFFLINSLYFIIKANKKFKLKIFTL